MFCWMFDVDLVINKHFTYLRVYLIYSIYLFKKLIYQEISKCIITKKEYIRTLILQGIL